MRRPIGGVVRVGVGVESCHGRTGAAGTFDVQHPGVGEHDVDPVLLGQGRPEHLLLHLPVERHRGQSVVPGPDVDQRVLVGQLGQRSAQSRALLGPHRGHRRLQGRRGEVVPSRPPGRPKVSPTRTSASPCSRPICPASTRSARVHRPVSNTSMPATFPTRPAGQVEPLPRAYRAVDHPDVSDLLPAAPALDLEHPARRRGVRASRRRPVAGSRSRA